MSVRDVLMANKLKEGVQDALVYLRMLEGAKLAPVYERKRVQLMSRLLDLQGDTRKEAPPKFEDDSDDDDDEEIEAPESPEKKASQGSTTEAEKKERRNSKLSDIKSRFDQPSRAGNYKYKTLEELKKEREMKKLGIKTDSQDETNEPAPASPSTEEVPDSTTAASANGDTSNTVAEEIEEIEELKEEDEVDRPSNDIDAQEQKVPEELVVDKKARSHTVASKFGKFFKGKSKDKDRSLSIPENTGSTDNISQISAENTSIAPEEETTPSIGGAEEEKEDQKPFSSKLERVTRRLGKYSYQKVMATLNGDTFHFAKPNKDKDGTTLSLVGAATAVRDSYQFELHTVDKSYTFRTDSEELCIKWVESLKGAIDGCTPVEELPEENEEDSSGGVAVPQITVSVDEEGGTGGGGGGEGTPNIKESLSYENFSFGGKKKKQEMPDPSTAQMKGYLYKKGKFGWDKVWVVLTYDNSLFMSTNETSKKVSGVIPLGPESKVEEKKINDKKYPHALWLASGKSKETFATDSASDFNLWLTFLKQASGNADIQELLSEDEDAGGELYEELELQDEPAPVIPVSPRPEHHSFPAATAQPQDEEIYDDFDQDIYEGLDDLDVPDIPSPVKAPTIPSLPPRNEVKAAAPSLPPRNQPQQQESPALPPRPSKGGGAPVSKPPLDYEAPSPSPISKKGVVIPNPQPVEEELYDDVVGLQTSGGGGIEEMEETYDDVVSTKAKILSSNVSTGDLYEDMVTGGGEDDQEDYCDMIMPGPGQVIEESDELYVDVDTDEPPPRPPLPSSNTSIPSRPPPPASPVTRPTASPVTRPPASPVTRPPAPKSVVTTTKPKDSPTLKTKATSPATTTPPSSRVTRPAPPVTSSSINPKRPGSGKVANLSKMFGDSPTGESEAPRNKRGLMSGNLKYMGPGKTSYTTDWIVLEGTTLIFYKGPNEKLSHYRLSTKEAELHIESSDGKLGFHVKKGSAIHKFSCSSLEEYGQWIGPIAHVITKVLPPPDSLYQAKEDYIGEGKFVFKKDEILWVLGEESATSWMGIAGASIREFRESSGLFPSSKAGPLSQDESVYY
ncbi:PREDICTED: uncharacterized protein LOC109580477 [Amphimedon queenslandica]|uniref:PH domain-containing protein n=1 Tax=Amphimedon queenslandica TaxID=400682 RepID=A0A1X7VFL9_AMPQE|nr:PREDICTED: uncharacterized protein LOC109580477 [Amphimedon queenslandica]|eukprot:XP_019849255.1 PREDICTED: uncharacterized protein LOC109580477 [Amphimedon queenslandica]